MYFTCVLHFIKRVDIFMKMLDLHKQSFDNHRTMFLICYDNLIVYFMFDTV